MELNQLRYFLKLAEVSNFTHAADELGITQPALSRSIAKLEDELGQPLFDRMSRTIALTDAGRLFSVRAEQIVTLADDALLELTDRDDCGRIRVGAIPTIAPFLLPGILREFRDQSPDVSVIAYEETTEKLLNRCRQGEVDVAILAAPVDAKYLQTETLFEEGFSMNRIVCPATSYRFVGNKRFSPLRYSTPANWPPSRNWSH
jgi:LysR family hydrogen peroxide-inducible transcriptional activator